VEKKKEAFSRSGKDIISASFSHPRDIHAVTSPFWARRVYRRFKAVNGSRKYLSPENGTHRGLDLQGREGDPVYAIADGTVVLAEPMFYEGGFTVIDHGNMIFSYYMHQSKINVAAGRRVRAGETIGRVGSTGIVTGAHLHVSLVINGVHADPLSLLPLRIRD
jgi:murein DD-endopeptidase MepM/ murein hydrolase activator NlpD